MAVILIWRALVNESFEVITCVPRVGRVLVFVYTHAYVRVCAPYAAFSPLCTPPGGPLWPLWPPWPPSPPPPPPPLLLLLLLLLTVSSLIEKRRDAREWNGESRVTTVW